MANEVLFQALNSDAAVTALCGSKIYPTSAPQHAVLPYVVFDAQAEPMATKDGFTGTDIVQYSVTAWALTADKAAELARAIRNATDYKDVTAGNTTARFTVQSTASGREDEGEAHYTIIILRARAYTV